MRGILFSLCSIYKCEARALLFPTLPKAFECFQLISSPQISNNSLLRKLMCKLCQRIGLCFMKPRVAKWRYERGFRSLNHNLAPDVDFASKLQLQQQSTETCDDQEELYDDLPDTLEDILDSLLLG